MVLPLGEREKKQLHKKTTQNTHKPRSSLLRGNRKQRKSLKECERTPEKRKGEKYDTVEEVAKGEPLQKKGTKSSLKRKSGGLAVYFSQEANSV